MAHQRPLVMPRLRSMVVGDIHLGEHEVRPYVIAWFSCSFVQGVVLGSWWADTWVCTLHGFLVF